MSICLLCISYDYDDCDDEVEIYISPDQNGIHINDVVCDLCKQKDEFVQLMGRNKEVLDVVKCSCCSRICDIHVYHYEDSTLEPIVNIFKYVKYSNIPICRICFDHIIDDPNYIKKYLHLSKTNLLDIVTMIKQKVESTQSVSKRERKLKRKSSKVSTSK